jgi:hypothetical protein
VACKREELHQDGYLTCDLVIVGALFLEKYRVSQGRDKDVLGGNQGALAPTDVVFSQTVGGHQWDIIATNRVAKNTVLPLLYGVKRVSVWIREDIVLLRTVPILERVNDV